MFKNIYNNINDANAGKSHCFAFALRYANGILATASAPATIAKKSHILHYLDILS